MLFAIRDHFTGWSQRLHSGMLLLRSPLHSDTPAAAIESCVSAPPRRAESGRALTLLQTIKRLFSARLINPYRHLESCTTVTRRKQILLHLLQSY